MVIHLSFGNRNIPFSLGRELDTTSICAGTADAKLRKRHSDNLKNKPVIQLNGLL